MRLFGRSLRTRLEGKRRSERKGEPYERRNVVEHMSDEIWDYNSGHVWIFIIRGELDVYLSSDLRDRLERALTDSPDALLIDLEETTFMDASALGVLVTALKKARAMGATLRLVAPSAPVERLLSLTQTEEVLPIECDLITAYARVAERAADLERLTGLDGAA